MWISFSLCYQRRLFSSITSCSLFLCVCVCCCCCRVCACSFLSWFYPFFFSISLCFFYPLRAGQEPLPQTPSTVLAIDSLDDFLSSFYSLSLCLLVMVVVLTIRPRVLGAWKAVPERRDERIKRDGRQPMSWSFLFIYYFFDCQTVGQLHGQTVYLITLCACVRACVCVCVLVASRRRPPLGNHSFL